ncbi:hypothetical protein [Novosphingobium sp.]|uniref:hypothetical protein n=1 Tax=Novosphingobium sp. TaxID=1874826 RepID=UPI00262ABF6A|nr:hypothetical protein [Novosphingobium sp.]
MIWQDEVRLYCDTAVLELPSAKVWAFASKAIHGVAAPYAVTATLIEQPDRAQGIVPLAEALARFGPHGLPSSGDVLGACQDWLAEAARDHVQVGRLLIGCNYPETGPELLIIATDDLGYAKPFEAVQLASFACSSNESVEYLDAARDGFDRDRMLALIDRQRASLMDTPGYGTTYGIGGEVVEIRVQRGGVVSSAVRQWPDRVGEVIRP